MVDFLSVSGATLIGAAIMSVNFWVKSGLFDPRSNTISPEFRQHYPLVARIRSWSDVFIGNTIGEQTCVASIHCSIERAGR
jgi:hypothetical protein